MSSKEKPHRLSSCQLFQYKSITYSIIRSLNSFRESKKLKPFYADPFLVKVAMRHSKRMALGKIECSTNGIKDMLENEPFTNYCTRVTHIDKLEHAFTEVVNQWVTDKELVFPLMSECDCCGVGIGFTDTEDVFFTLIIALRSVIGSSRYRGSELKSYILFQKTLEIVNMLRTAHFNLLPFAPYPPFIDLAFKFAELPLEQLTPKFVRTKIGMCSSYSVGYGKIEENSTPEQIVEEWMNQVSSKANILGDFNCVGFGFFVRDKILYSIRICARIIPASIIDGTETYIEPVVLARQLFNSMNELRDQHGLPAMEFDDDLTVVAQAHAEWVANDEDEEDNPLNQDFFLDEIEPSYEATDISHMCCNEITRAPKTFMAKWRNNPDCISVLLNNVDHIGIGLCFSADYMCHCTVIIGSLGNEISVTNKIVKF